MIQTFATFDADGSPTGFWRTDIYEAQEDGSRHANIPVSAVEITDADWREFIENQGRRRRAGGVVTVYTPPPAPAVIAPVTAAQAKIALSRAGLLATVRGLVSSGGDELQIWFSDAQLWQRDNAHVLTMAAALELSSSQVDDLFAAARLIQ